MGRMSNAARSRCALGGGEEETRVVCAVPESGVAHATFRFSAPFDCVAAACVGVEQRCLHLVTVPQPRRRRRCCCYGGPAALSNSDGLECSEALGKRGSFLAK